MQETESLKSAHHYVYNTCDWLQGEAKWFKKLENKSERKTPQYDWHSAKQSQLWINQQDTVPHLDH